MGLCKDVALVETHKPSKNIPDDGDSGVYYIDGDCTIRQEGGMAHCESSLDQTCGLQSRASKRLISRRRQQLKLGDATTEAEQIAWCQGVGGTIFDDSK